MSAVLRYEGYLSHALARPGSNSWLSISSIWLLLSLSIMGFFRRGLALSAFLLHLLPLAHGYGQNVKATGNTVSFQVNLTWEDSQPAGISRKMIKSNGHFPAPTLNLKQGDDVEFLVNNDMPFSTTIHFHGTFSECILPGEINPLDSNTCCTRNRTTQYPLV